MREGIKPTKQNDRGPLPTSTCPVCKYEMDSATCVGVEGIEPQPGDVSLCLNCGEVLQYNDILVLKTVTDEELAFMDNQSKAAITMARSFIIKRGRIR